MKKILFSCLLLLFAQQVQALPKYSVVINADKSATTLHLFLKDDASNIPAITDIYSEKSDASLSSFANEPNKSGKSLKKIIDDTVIQLNQLHIPTNSVSLTLLGTEGMRSLKKENQIAIYQNVKEFLQRQYDFKIQKIKTISAKKQAVYDWVAVNYLEGNFRTAEFDNVIEMGDDSTELAFLTDDNSRPKDAVTVEIDHQRYTLFAKSFTTLGLESARLQLNRIRQHEACYQLGHFNLSACQSAFGIVISAVKISDQLLPLPSSRFAVIGSADQVYGFFGVEDGSEESLVARVGAVCDMSWSDMKVEYADSGISEERLFSLCANGIYLDQLFYQTYRLSGPSLWVTNHAHDGRKIDWAYGFILIDGAH